MSAKAVRAPPSNDTLQVMFAASASTGALVNLLKANTFNVPAWFLYIGSTHRSYVIVKTPLAPSKSMVNVSLLASEILEP